MACCTGHRKNEYFEKISLAPKLCEMYATILLKLFLNFHQHIIEEVNATQPFHRDSCDILTKNNSLLVPNLYNNYSGLVKL